MLADEAATIDDLDLLLDLADSQITYRARYLVGLALKPARDMVVLDPFNTRSTAFQIFTLKEHLAILPSLLEDGMLEEPSRILLPLATEVETAEAAVFGPERSSAIEPGVDEAVQRRRRSLFSARRQRRPHDQARLARVNYNIHHRTTYTSRRRSPLRVACCD